jgi:hypothetical protein
MTTKTSQDLSDRLKALITAQKTEKPPYIRVALGGMAGQGKTFLAGTAGKGTRTLLLDTEDGSATYSAASFLASPDASDIHKVSFDDLKQKSATPAQFIQRVESFIDELTAAPLFDVLVLDSLTDLQASFLSNFDTKDPRIAYGAWTESIYRLVSKARRVKAHVIFLSRVKVVEDAVTNSEVIRFDVSPGAWSNISGLFDSIGLVTLKRNALKRETTQVVTFDSNPRFQGKDRYELGELTNPSLKSIIKAVVS